MSLKYKAIGAAFQFLSLSGLAGLVRQRSSCRGVIFTMHRVLPGSPAEFSPNSILQITPDFLEQVIVTARKKGVDFVSLDEALERLAAPEKGKPFAVLSFDDGYRDNLQYALPILKKHNVPFTLYIPTALIDGRGEVWWQALEDIIAANDSVNVPDEAVIPSATLEDKHAAFNALYWRMRSMPEPERVKLIHAIAGAHGLDLFAHCRALIMDWEELRAFINEPLCTIGAHTVYHYELAKLPLEEAKAEILNSIAILKAKTGKAPQHLSYPIGGKRSAFEREYQLARDLKLKSAVTTRPGGLYPHHLDTPTALPRISLNGNYQKKRFIDVFLTGAIFSVIGDRMS